MKRILFFAVVVGLFASCEPRINDILEESRYAQGFDFIWQTLDANYPYFDYRTLNMNKEYKRYIRAIADEETEEGYHNALLSFLCTFGDPNIGINYRSRDFKYVFTFPYDIPVKDYAAYNLYTNDIYAGVLFEDDPISPETFMDDIHVKFVQRKLSDGRLKNYPLLICGVGASSVNQHQSESEKMMAIMTSAMMMEYIKGGVVLDFRCSSSFNSVFAQKIVPYLFESGQHELYTSILSGKELSYTIGGNGMYAQVPIAIIVNEATGGECSWLARILKDRPNVAIIGRANAGPGCISTVAEGNGVRLLYPDFRMEKDGVSFYEPLEPELLVDWAGSNDEEDIKMFGGNYPDKIDYCLVAALDFIDSFN
jgi:hypothetical protein